MANINGNGLPNLLRGTPGPDVIKGLGSFDALFGNGGNDSLYGGSSNDFLDGGKGKDLFWGGTGKDVFNFKTGDGFYSGGSGDVVRDYVDDTDFFNVPGHGLGAVSLVDVTNGTIVSYAGGSFFALHYHSGDWSTDDFK